MSSLYYIRAPRGENAYSTWYGRLQASWSDTVYFLERERLEAWEAVEVGEADAPVVDYDDRHDGLE